MNPAIVGIGAIATIVIFLQNRAAELGFGWALIHGAGPAALLAFLPLAAGVLALMTAAVSLNRHPPVRFGVVAAAIVIANEALLPTPFKAWRRQRTIEAVTVTNIRDELVVSARGNPIGIRLTFEAIFPSSRAYAVGHALESDSDERLYALQFNHASRSTVQPEPGDHNYFQSGVTYTFSTDFLPNFLSYDDKTGVSCLTDRVGPGFSEKDLLGALSKSRNLKYRTAIQVSTEQALQPVVAAKYVTARDYDIEAMYRTIEVDGSRRCGS